uniref:Guanylate cyclase domain-containing protein n=1 Tax=Dunaliella tertiolecta TaxID=3047 RepID=A0A6S8Q644_DUNTE|mmetsp:Transcript_712/g.1714  ORF Transcript_712/g.1714 Transcript_712/m.1714 type:complete len:1156 (-) Transcript_712:480-3947(-)
MVLELFSCWRGHDKESKVESNLKGDSQNSPWKHEIGSKYPQAPNPPPASTFSSTVSSLSPAPIPATSEPWANNPLYVPPTAQQNDPMPCFQHVRWEEHLVESIPFSCAIVTSDAKEVLFKKHGLEPAAARLLDQALLSNSTSCPLDGPISKKAAEESSSSAGSFLAALLGHEMETVALSTARVERFWKGTVSVEHPVEEIYSGSSVSINGTHATHKALLLKPLPGISEEPFDEAAGSAERSTAAGAELDEGAATAGAHAAEAQQVAARNCQTEGKPGPAGRPWGQDSRSPDRAAQMASVLGRGGEDSVSAVPSDPAAGFRPAAGPPTGARLQRHAAAQEAAPGAPAPGCVMAGAGAVAAPPFERRREHPNRAASAPDMSAWRNPGHKPPHPEPQVRKAVRSQKHAAAQEAAAAVQEAAAAVIAAAGLPSPRWKEQLSRTASGQAKMSQGQDPMYLEPSMKKPLNLGLGAPPDSNKSVRWESSLEGSELEDNEGVVPPKYKQGQSCDLKPCNIPMQSRACKTEDGGDGGVRNGVADDSMIPATARSSDTVKPPLLTRAKSMSSANHRTRAKRNSLCMSKEAMECFKNGNDESMTRTVALLKSLSQQAQATADPDVARTSKKGAASPATGRLRSKSEAQLNMFDSSGISLFSDSQCNNEHPSTTMLMPVVASDCEPSRVCSSGDPAPMDPRQNAYERKTTYPPLMSRTTSSSLVQSFDGTQLDGFQVNVADQMSMASASTRAGSWQPDQNLPGTSNTLVSEDAHPGQKAPCNLSSPKSLASDTLSGGSAQLLEKVHKHPLSFDVMVSMLWPHMGNRSPLLVVICNSTEHWQVRTILTALAESQLDLLSRIMPQHAIEFLATESSEAIPEHVGQLARAHKGVTLLFMDIVGFTSMSKNVKPVEVMVFLNTLFSLFDRLTDEHGVHKVETAGDCYIVSGGIMSANQSENGFGLVVEDQDPEESAKRVMEFAKAMLEAAKQVNMPDTNEPVRVRVGLHTGDVVSGLIGSKLPKFSIFGDAMNTASRMESTGVPGRIHVSETTQKLLPAERWESTGGVQVKGKGQMQTYLWVPPMAGAVSPPVSSFKPSSTDGAPCLQAFKHTHKLLRQLNEAHAAQAAIAMIEPARHGVRKGREAGVGASGSSCALFFRRSVPVMKPDTV